MTDARLAAAFAAGLPSGAGQSLARADDVTAALRSALLAAQAAHPEFQVDTAIFLKRLGACVKPASEGGVAAALAPVHAADLYLACACAAGDRRALGEL